MPLPNMLKNIIGNGPNNKMNQSDSGTESHFGKNLHSPKLVFSSSPNQNGTFKFESPISSPNITKNNRSAKTLSQINSLHSHRNLKSPHQMLLAESMFDSDVEVSLDSCLNCSFQQCCQEKEILPCFVQYMESLGKQTNTMIKCFLQANCLMIYFRQHFSDINLNNNQDDHDYDNEFVSTIEAHNKHYENFRNDFRLLFNQFLINNDSNLFIDPTVQENIRQLFNHKSDEIPNVDEKENYMKEIQLFNVFYKTLHAQIETEYYEKFLRSNFFLKYEYEILRNQQFTLSDILFSNTPIASFYLDFMNSEGMKKYLDFLVMFRNYKTFSCQYSDAVSIYDRFFNYARKPDSFLYLSDYILDELKQSIQNEQLFRPECFDKIASILLQYFSKTYFPQFIQSNVFSEYMQNCQTKLSADKINCRSSSKRILPNQSSTTSSTISKAYSVNNINFDQETLWNRNLKGHLQFTHIDKYGRMNSSLEPEPNRTQKKSDTKLTQLLRRLSLNHSSEDKNKQDDAWKIAESIINDVCSVTNQQNTIQNNQ